MNDLSIESAVSDTDVEEFAAVDAEAFASAVITPPMV